MKPRILATLLGATAALTAHATVYSYTWSSGFANSGVIPDGNPSGWSDTRTLNAGGFGTDLTITDVNVRLNVSGGWNGDLYGYLTHSSGFAVLLNRVGKTSGNSFGYGDAGMSVTLDDSASTDIHLYGTLSSPYVYQPDARTADPATVLDTDSRTALLSSFNSLNPSGSWTLFFADMASGSTSTVLSWGLDIEAVPEPITWALVIFGAVVGGVTLARSKWLRERIERWRVVINAWLDAA